MWQLLSSGRSKRRWECIWYLKPKTESSGILRGSNVAAALLCTKHILAIFLSVVVDNDYIYNMKRFTYMEPKSKEEIVTLLSSASDALLLTMWCDADSWSLEIMILKNIRQLTGFERECLEEWATQLPPAKRKKIEKMLKNKEELLKIPEDRIDTRM